MGEDVLRGMKRRKLGEIDVGHRTLFCVKRSDQCKSDAIAVNRRSILTLTHF